MTDEPASDRMPARSRRVNPLQEFPSDDMQVALVSALRHAFIARKKEGKLTQDRLAARSGQDCSTVSRILSGRDWRMNSIAVLAEALDLRLEFAFVDRKDPARRFKQHGASYVPADLAGAQMGASECQRHQSASAGPRVSEL